uniref:Phospholipase A2 inhibitor 31 kDa subunit-like n=1 Tax=Oncorhynchus kisutch TaxID=8019 RepID=A0A8C7KRE8_ONCKI
MKAVCFSLLLLLLACSFGEGLKCNRCVGKGCRNTVETCRVDHDTCGTVLFKPPLRTYPLSPSLGSIPWVSSVYTPSLGTLLCLTLGSVTNRENKNIGSF